ncbi:hypothetical protein BGZ80_006786 [Entomortierella chlamydospora]|uniref:Casein kinase substrate phosphoprotein PP28 domain-containing protein n=1 Tax=Entomortierella chlamydospora TaxID=101097 RepID=A0A9P6MYL1_9FUNG|nr:hypothetical protein BGZ80_006786 [Entomortierella chlamydospora]
MAGGKFKKPQRGGGRKFSRRIEAVHTTTTQSNAGRGGKIETPKELALSGSESGSESDARSGSKSGSESKSESESESESGPESDSHVESALEICAQTITINPNHLQPVVNKRQKNKPLDMNTPIIEMSRKEREAAEREAAKQRYWKLHQEGKTDEAKADMARLAIIRKQREEAAAKRLAEAKAKEDAAAAKIGLTPSMRL